MDQLSVILFIWVSSQKLNQKTEFAIKEMSQKCFLEKATKGKQGIKVMNR